MEKEINTISMFEYELLKLLYRFGYRYIARDMLEALDTSLVFYKSKPKKFIMFWESDFKDMLSFNYIGSELFKFVKWKDKEPTLIADIIHHFDFRGL